MFPTQKNLLSALAALYEVCKPYLDGDLIRRYPQPPPSPPCVLAVPARVCRVLACIERVPGADPPASARRLTAHSD